MDAGSQPRTGRGRRVDFGPATSAQKMFDKEPPKSLEAEMSLLGALLLEPKAVGDVIGIVKGPEDFYKDAHGHIYRSIVEVFDTKNSGDLVQIMSSLQDKGVADQIGGGEYLVELANSVPSAANAKHYATIVAEKAKIRRLIDAAGQILYDAYHTGDLGPDGAREVLDKAEMSVFEIAQETSASEPQHLAELLDAEMRRIEAEDFEGGAYSGVPTSYGELDEMLRGFQPGEMVVIAARPSMGKCLTADSEITLRDGSVVTIEELYRRRCGEIPTLRDNLRLDWASPSDFIDDGTKPAFEVTTRLGRRVRTTLTHPFLTIDGWKPLGQISEGDRIAVPRVLNAFGAARMRDCEARLLGYLIGDGGLTSASPKFTNSNPRIAADFAQAVDDFGGLSLTLSSTRPGEAPSWRVVKDGEQIAAARDAFALDLRSALSKWGGTQRDLAARVGVSPASVTHWLQGKTVPDDPTLLRCREVLGVEALGAEHEPGKPVPRRNAPSALALWLESHGLMGKGSHEKCVPPAVFTLERRLVALFLNRLFATDGWATLLQSGQAQLGYATVNERLARQVQHLLLRFGVVASLRLRWVRYREARRPSWQLDITDARSIAAFIDEIGIFGKEDALARVGEAVRAKHYQTNRDLIPCEVWGIVERAKGSMSWSELARRVGAPSGLHQFERAPSRARLAKLADALPDSDERRRLTDLARSDVYWDEVVSIVPLGPRQVYDLTVPGTHNFVANDVCVHNTALALNLAEQIAIGGVPVPGAPPTRSMPIALFSLEMGKNAIVQRMLSARAGVQSQQLRGGHKIPDADLRRIYEAADDLRRAPIYIDDTPNMTVLTMRARARRLVAQHGVRCIMIDYLQLLTAPGAARESRQVEVSTISRGVKALARELNVPVIVLSQLNRASEQREGNRPRMADLRESGSIEQDADVIILLHREEYYHTQDENWQIENQDKVGIAELIVAKQRNGPTGIVKLKWDNRTTRFTNLDIHSSPPGGYVEDKFGPMGGGSAGGGGASRGGYASPAQAASQFPGGQFPGGAPASSIPNPFENAPFDASPRASFAPGKRTGPISNHRDGGGPDRESPPDPGGAEDLDIPV